MQNLFTHKRKHIEVVASGCEYIYGMKIRDNNIMLDRKKEMLAYMDNFQGMPDRLLKYNEILLEREDAAPECYQDTLSYRRLAIALTTTCNLSCLWCYRHDPQYKSILGKNLDFDLYRSFVENTSGRFRMVHLAGLGEPTLYPDFIDAVRISKKLSPNIKVTSNGSLLNAESINRYIDAGLTHIEISIDAFNKAKLKEYRGVDLEHMIKIVNYISEETPLHLQINSVVSDINAAELYEMIDVFGDAKKINVWHTIPLFTTAQMRNNQINPLTTNSYQTLLLDLSEKIKANGLKWELLPEMHGVKLDPIIEMKKKHNICFTCFEDPYISVKGRFNYCSRQEYSAVADISEGFESAWNHSSLLEFRKNMLQGNYPEYCGKLCFLKENC